MNCRICKTETKSFGVFSGMPLAETSEVLRLYSTPTEFTKKIDIELLQYPLCGHFQIKELVSKASYEDYLASPSLATYSKKLRDLQTEQIKILSSLNKISDNFIEIGCGDGSFLEQARRSFKNTVGIEPSKSYWKICKTKGLNVINKPLTRELTFDYKFDSFCSRQVFEHLINPLEGLSIIHDLINAGATGLIEVPNGQKMIDDGRYFDLFIDHLNYFTHLSLSHLAKLAGFEIIMLRESFGGDFLEIYLKKPKKSIDLLSKRSKDFAFIKDAVSKYKSISLWGAGAKAQSIMTALEGTLNLRYIFDSDPNKHGKYLCNSSVKIAPPSLRHINENELIVIFAISYQDEIIDSLRNLYQYRGDILCLAEQPQILKI
ncbi:MAG: methyltransferase domain-containing protein [Candidatus Omnitrophica bacterium]|nr:methyltransferase domain-containing protein [Candidatus Omnitrophota bacterium]